jgi:glycosyltransferase involved in cell wall biosynthesis
MTRQVKRVAVMWTHLSGYLNACLKALAATEGVELFVSNIRAVSEAPYDEQQFAWIQNRYQWEGGADAAELLQSVEQFGPDVILSSGWNIPAHRHVLEKFRGRAVRLISLDNQWRGTFRQWLGVLVARWYLHPLCDALFVAGDRQALFARKLGYSKGRILRGVLSCDQEKFAAIWRARKASPAEARAFVYVGRFAAVKGLDVLVAAYRQYRAEASEPWPLRCYGAGPLQGLLENVEGIEIKGFCQPENLPGVMLGAACLILPSTVEPWGLVVHEAASSGLAIICTDAVGASAHLVLEGTNGYIVKTGDARELAAAMLKFGGLSAQERRAMGENSNRLSLQFTPSAWARNLLDGANEISAEVAKNY